MITTTIATWIGLGVVTLLCLISLYFFTSSSNENKPFQQ